MRSPSPDSPPTISEVQGINEPADPQPPKVLGLICTVQQERSNVCLFWQNMSAELEQVRMHLSAAWILMDRREPCDANLEHILRATELAIYSYRGPEAAMGPHDAFLRPFTAWDDQRLPRNYAASDIEQAIGDTKPGPKWQHGHPWTLEDFDNLVEVADDRADEERRLRGEDPAKEPTNAALWPKATPLHGKWPGRKL